LQIGGDRRLAAVEGDDGIVGPGTIVLQRKTPAKIKSASQSCACLTIPRAGTSW
jgi:hypothetical protein